MAGPQASFEQCMSLFRGTSRKLLLAKTLELHTWYSQHHLLILFCCTKVVSNTALALVVVCIVNLTDNTVILKLLQS